MRATTALRVRRQRTIKAVIHMGDDEDLGERY
jgi:hypothetical protein